ncbi:hypothetical protein H4R23_001763 [Coemansia sp. Cherry 401B]|nr:hypothetical protein IWW54_002208 [Coemansia sp. RSA 2705]KAJ2319601.1 hypothetical protein IWW52_001877 [Coemansia sp. RSA 2704]KAJ2737534.1 hypothetical protein H4R23_001763 [Coemansia sp. Cherry 401B]
MALFASADGWLSRLTRYASLQSSLCAIPGYLPSAKDCDATVVVPPPSCPAGRVLDSARVDTAIAILAQAQQQDQAGNPTTAAQLMIAGTEYLALSLQSVDLVDDIRLRQRLAALQLLLEPSSGIGAQRTGRLKPAADRTAGDCMLELLTKAVVVWLVLVGNLLAWMLNVCYALNVHGHLLRAVQVLFAWLARIDRETAVSHKAMSSATAVASLIARIVAESCNSEIGRVGSS